MNEKHQKLDKNIKRKGDKMNIDPTTTKYLISAQIIADGVIEKPDVVGAIFGQTEGLIGDKYVAVDPGGGGDLLANGDTITDTNSPTDIMDLISKYAFGDVGGEE